MQQREILVAAQLGRTPLLWRFPGILFEPFECQLAGFFAVGIFGFCVTLSTAQMFFKISLAGAQSCKRAAFQGFVNHHIRDDALGLNRLATGCVVAGGGELDASVWTERPDGLYRALAKSLVAHDGRALVVLQCAGHDFTGRCRAFIDQHHQRHGFQGGWQALERVIARTTQVKLGRCLVDKLAFGQLAIG